MKQSLSTQGNSAIEIMIALGLIGLVTLGIFGLSQDVLKYIQRNKISTARDQLAAQFRQSAGRIANLKLSLTKPENQDFFNCVCGQGTGCVSARPYSLSLYDPAKADTPIQTYYDSSGVPCLKTAENCVIEVNLGFVAQCAPPTLPAADPTPLAACGTAVEFFAVTYTVQRNESTPTQGNLFKTIKGSVFTQVSTLAPAGSGVCP